MRQILLRNVTQPCPQRISGDEAECDSHYIKKCDRSLLKKCFRFSIKKCFRFSITKCENFIQNATFVTKCNVHYQKVSVQW